MKQEKGGKARGEKRKAQQLSGPTLQHHYRVFKLNVNVVLKDGDTAVSLHSTPLRHYLVTPFVKQIVLTPLTPLYLYITAVVVEVVYFVYYDGENHSSTAYWYLHIPGYSSTKVR